MLVLAFMRNFTSFLCWDTYIYTFLFLLLSKAAESGAPPALDVLDWGQAFVPFGGESLAQAVDFVCWSNVLSAE